MEKIDTIAQLIRQGLESSAAGTRAVLQAIQLGYELAEMEQQDKEQTQKAG